MKDKDKVILQKMIVYCEEIGSFTKDLTLEGFSGNIIINRATTQTIQNIGELSKKLSEDLRERNKQIPWKPIRDARNFIAHEYEGINWEDIWDIVNVSIPQLKKQLNNILKD